MAIRAINATLGTALGEGKFNTSAGLGANAVAPDSTAVAAAIAVLVADAASPTQAHVDDLVAAWTPFLAAQNTYTASTTGNLVLLINDAVLTSANAVNAAVKAALQQARNLGIMN